MGRKGPSKHMKRHVAPRFWPIHRKEFVWSIKPSPGPHVLKQSIALLVVVRDILQYASTGREARMLIKQGKIKVDGTPCFDERSPLGVMDIIELPEAEEFFRVLPTKGGKIKLHPITSSEAEFKLCKILGKTTLKGGNTQLNLHDGRNIIINDSEISYKVDDVLQIAIPKQEILEHISVEQGNYALVTGGRSMGRHGVITGYGFEPGWKKTAILKTPLDEQLRTLVGYIFSVGKKEPLISLPEAS